jgi:hypothetical protein
LLVPAGHAVQIIPAELKVPGPQGTHLS